MSGAVTVGLTLVGLLAGGLANYIIYSWAYFPRPISPWARAPRQSGPRQSLPGQSLTVPEELAEHTVAEHAAAGHAADVGQCGGALRRRWYDRIPLVGWLSLRRESPLHGRGFWIRPLLIELACGAALPALYWYYVHSGALLPLPARTPVALAAFSSWGQALFVCHSILLVLLVAASFIDFDEQTIPDLITLPGTLLALLLSVLPWRSFLPAEVFWGQQLAVAETLFPTPAPYAVHWETWRGLTLGLAIWGGWIFALLDRRWVTRHGLVRACGYLLHGIRRRPETRSLLGLAAIGAGCLMFVWWLGGAAWAGLLTSLVGLAVGGGVVWAVRIVAGYAMGQEAMGFGDVTLMAMIGAFLGWQAAVAGFFLAPMAAIPIVLVQFLITRQPAVPFGPYLCAGTAIAVIGWDKVWNQTLVRYAELGTVVIWVLLAALLLMAAMLMVWGMIKRALWSY